MSAKNETKDCLPTPQPFLLIVGQGHSGGTILNLLLGVSPLTVSAGECFRVCDLLRISSTAPSVIEVWRPALEKLEACGFDINSIDEKYIKKADEKFWACWIAAVTETLRGRVVVDKTPAFKITKKIVDANLVKPFFVHLIRDPRAVCFSYQRKIKARKKSRFKAFETIQNAFQLIKHARGWSKANVEIIKYLENRPNSILLKYEDLVNDTDVCIHGVLESAGAYFGLNLSAGVPCGLQDLSLDSPIFDHVMFSGNRVRLKENRRGVSLQEDVSFLTQMSWFDWCVTTFCCWRYMRRVGYKISR